MQAVVYWECFSSPKCEPYNLSERSLPLMREGTLISGSIWHWLLLDVIVSGHSWDQDPRYHYLHPLLTEGSLGESCTAGSWCLGCLAAHRFYTQCWLRRDFEKVQSSRVRGSLMFLHKECLRASSSMRLWCVDRLGWKELILVKGRLFAFSPEISKNT